jgi:hypothetical protein
LRLNSHFYVSLTHRALIFVFRPSALAVRVRVRPEAGKAGQLMGEAASKGSDPAMRGAGA